MNFNKASILFTMTMVLTLLSIISVCAEEAPMRDHAKMDAGSQTKMFLEKRQIDGYTVSFHVMEATKNMQHGGPHNLMVKIENKNMALSEVKINSKIIYPNGKSDSKMLMKMGDWYMAGYDLTNKGKHQVMVLFKTQDGKKHKGGVYYNAR